MGTAAMRALSAAICSRRISSVVAARLHPGPVSASASGLAQCLAWPCAHRESAPIACFIERTTQIGWIALADEARTHLLHLGIASSCFFTRSGSARSSKKKSMNSSRVSSKVNSSMPSPSGEA